MHIQEGKGHEGGKPQQVVFCDKHNCVFTSGFSKMSDRQYAVWDDVSCFCLCYLDYKCLWSSTVLIYIFSSFFACVSLVMHA